VPPSLEVPYFLPANFAKRASPSRIAMGKIGARGKSRRTLVLLANEPKPFGLDIEVNPIDSQLRPYFDLGYTNGLTPLAKRIVRCETR